MGFSQNGASGANVLKRVEVVQPFERENAQNLSMAEKTVLGKLRKARSVQILLFVQVNHISLKPLNVISYFQIIVKSGQNQGY